MFLVFDAGALFCNAHAPDTVAADWLFFFLSFIKACVCVCFLASWKCSILLAEHLAPSNTRIISQNNWV